MRYNFKHSEIADRIEATRLLSLNFPSEDHEFIFYLMDAYDHFSALDHDYPTDLDWRPTSVRVAEVVSHLTAPEHRYALDQWYVAADKAGPLNPSAQRFRQILYSLIRAQECDSIERNIEVE